MQALNTSDYRGHNWPGSHDEEDSYPLYVFFLFRSSQPLMHPHTAPWS